MTMNANRDESPPESVLWTGRFLEMAKLGSWEYVRRTKATGVVVIVPVTRNREVILIEQYRPPLGRRCLELPAGLAGDTDDVRHEPLEEAARRELFEETGYQAGQVVWLAEHAPSGGLTSETLTTFLATDLEKTGPGGGDAHEDIVVHVVPHAELKHWLAARAQDGLMAASSLYGGIWLAEQSGAFAG